jgi:hypothetical protein
LLISSTDFYCLIIFETFSSFSVTAFSPLLPDPELNLVFPFLVAST